MRSVDVYVDIEAQDGSGRKATRIFTSQIAADQLMVTDLEAIPYKVSTHVRDKYDNATAVEDKGIVTPKTDYELDKSTWTFLRDELLYGSYWAGSKPDADHLGMYTLDSMKNAMEYRYDGSIYKFWDGVTDLGDDRKLGLNSFFHSGFTDKGGYPFSYFINMGRKVKISRMRVWQRYDYLYKTYGPRVFEIWISDDANAADGILEDWELVGTYAIVKAATDAEAMQEAIDGHEFWIYPADVDFTRQFQCYTLQVRQQQCTSNKKKAGAMPTFSFVYIFYPYPLSVTLTRPILLPNGGASFDTVHSTSTICSKRSLTAQMMF